jgi:Fe2+ transport system protein FeoA
MFILKIYLNYLFLKLAETKKKKNMSLFEAQADQKLQITDILSGEEAKRKLYSLGLHINDEIVKISNNKRGPVLFHCQILGRTKFAIGKDLAKKIIVQYGD